MRDVNTNTRQTIIKNIKRNAEASRNERVEDGPRICIVRLSLLALRATNTHCFKTDDHPYIDGFDVGNSRQCSSSTAAHCGHRQHGQQTEKIAVCHNIIDGNASVCTKGCDRTNNTVLDAKRTVTPTTTSVRWWSADRWRREPATRRR